MRPISDCSIWIRRLSDNCEGKAAVEFAFLIPVLLMLIFAVYEFGRAYWIQNTLQYAAEQTARCIMANPTVTSVTSGACPVSNNLAGLNANTPTTGTGSCGGSFGSCRWVQVTYTFTFNGFLTGIIKLAGHTNSSGLPTSITLTGRAQVPIS